VKYAEYGANRGPGGRSCAAQPHSLTERTDCTDCILHQASHHLLNLPLFEYHDIWSRKPSIYLQRDLFNALYTRSSSPALRSSQSAFRDSQLASRQPSRAVQSRIPRLAIVVFQESCIRPVLQKAAVQIHPKPKCTGTITSRVPFPFPFPGA
jgi:hypothetical protein